MRSEASHAGEAKHLAGRTHPKEHFTQVGDINIWGSKHKEMLIYFHKKFASQFLRFQSGERNWETKMRIFWLYFFCCIVLISKIKIVFTNSEKMTFSHHGWYETRFTTGVPGCLGSVCAELREGTERAAGWLEGFWGHFGGSGGSCRFYILDLRTWEMFSKFSKIHRSRPIEQWRA